MRINLSRWLASLITLSIFACAPAQEESLGSGFVAVNDVFWGANHGTPYPFTTDGEISCRVHPDFGHAIYFEPAEFTDESYIGTPLNKAAAEALKQANLTPNVPYSINKGADLSDAVELGLSVCFK